MNPKKLNFAEIKNALSRNAMKQIMAGSGGGFSCVCTDKKSAGMASCDTCDKWCKDNGHEGKDTCD